MTEMLNRIEGALAWLRDRVMSFAASHWVVAAIVVLGLLGVTAFLFRSLVPLRQTLGRIRAGMTQRWNAVETYVRQHSMAAVVLGGLSAVVAVSLALWLLPVWQTARLAGQNVSPEKVFAAENSARTTLAQILAGLFVLAGGILAWWRVEVARQGQVTERFIRAIDQLGSDKLEIRLGGIYALERIARDSSRDHGPIMEILTAFVRENARWEEPQQPEKGQVVDGGQKAQPRLPADIQAILTVLGRRKLTYGHGDQRRIDLSTTNLDGADLRRAHLEKARLDGARLEEARLRDAQLEGAFLFGAHLERADLSSAVGLTQEQIDGAFTDDKTKLPPGIVGRSKMTPTPQPPSQPTD